MILKQCLFQLRIAAGRSPTHRKKQAQKSFAMSTGWRSAAVDPQYSQQSRSSRSLKTIRIMRASRSKVTQKKRRKNLHPLYERGAICFCWTMDVLGKQRATERQKNFEEKT